MKKQLLITISILLTIIIIFLVIAYKVVSADTSIDNKNEIISYQMKLEQYIKSYGYTIENPNIIVNPYKISPLTALIIFETEDDEEVTVKVLGKDINSTYEKKYAKSKKHFIEVYGLYPDTNNQVEIKYSKIKKIFEIKTDSLPEDLKVEPVENDTNNLFFRTTNKYTYAVDNNNEVRWYLTKNYSKQIERINNGHLLLSNDEMINEDMSNGLVEMDLFGKIYNKYIINSGYYGKYIIDEDKYKILSDKIIEISKDGEILNINNIEGNNNDFKTENNILVPLYTENNFELKKGNIYYIEDEIKETDEKIYLINYKKIDKEYKKYDIEIKKEDNKISISGKFNNEKVYLILDKFMGKKIYEINNNKEIINDNNLKGKYSIYIKINNSIYKTNKYIII